MGKRKAYTPFSLSSEAGVTAAPVEGFIEVTQEVRPTIDTGFVDSKGQWIGHQTSDTAFNIYQKDDAIANGVTIITPSVNPDGTWPLDMTGYRDLQIAIKPTSGGNYAFIASMGPDSIRYANLSPVNASADLRGNLPQQAPQDFTDLFSDGSESCTADVWNIFYIGTILQHQKLLQFKITNNSGSSSNIETAFMRIL